MELSSRSAVAPQGDPIQRMRDPEQLAPNLRRNLKRERMEVQVERRPAVRSTVSPELR